MPRCAEGLSSAQTSERFFADRPVTFNRAVISDTLNPVANTTISALRITPSTVSTPSRVIRRISSVTSSTFGFVIAEYQPLSNRMRLP